MARYYRYLFLLPLFLMAACQEGGDAGDLLGQWRLNGTDDRYVGFSGSIAWFHSTDRREVFANFQHVGDSLFIQCTSIYGSPSDTTFIEKDFALKPFKNIRVKIEALDSDRLSISKDGQSWNFHKY